MDDINDRIQSLRSSLSDFPDSFQSTHSKTDFEQMVNKISGWVDEQNESTIAKEKEERIENVGKLLTNTINAIEKFKSGDSFEIAQGTLDIVSGVAVLVGGPYGAVAAACCSVIGAILSANQPKKPSVVEQIAVVVHKELVNFNKKLHNQEFNGLKRRVLHQTKQLQKLKLNEKLDDPNLWNDYSQFLGELCERIEAPVPFEYSDHLTEDADVADFVTALVTYCQAHTCLMVLLTIAKGRFEDIGRRREEIEVIERNIEYQMQDAGKQLAFLSDKKYLTFIGRLPSQGGQLTKILSLMRNVNVARQVELVRKSLNLPQLPSQSEVESVAKTVSNQRVKEKANDWGLTKNANHVMFLNNTKFPMKIRSGLVGDQKGNLVFEQTVQPYSSSSRSAIFWYWRNFSAGGYFTICFDASSSSSVEPKGDVRVIEFALSNCIGPKCNIQDMTGSECTKGLDTYKKMTSGSKRKDVHWVKDGVNYIAFADFVLADFTLPNVLVRAALHHTKVEYVWRFVVQDFDPAKDLEEEKEDGWFPALLKLV